MIFFCRKRWGDFFCPKRFPSSQVPNFPSSQVPKLLLFALVERCFVSRMLDFFYILHLKKHKQKKDKRQEEEEKHTKTRQKRKNRDGWFIDNLEYFVTNKPLY